MQFDDVAARLQDLYGQPFGGKASGRFRIPEKLLREMMGRRRLYAEDRIALAQALYERGLVLIDMDSFFVVTSANAFVNYRRVGREALATPPAG